MIKQSQIIGFDLTDLGLTNFSIFKTLAVANGFDMTAKTKTEYRQVNPEDVEKETKEIKALDGFVSIDSVSELDSVSSYINFTLEIDLEKEMIRRGAQIFQEHVFGFVQKAHVKVSALKLQKQAELLEKKADNEAKQMMQAIKSV